MKIFAPAKKVFVLAFFCSPLFLAPSFASAQQQPASGRPAEAKPSIRVENPDCNFGTAVQGSSVEHAFVVKNTGKGVLKIQHVRVA